MKLTIEGRLYASPHKMVLVRFILNDGKSEQSIDERDMDNDTVVRMTNKMFCEMKKVIKKHFSISANHYIRGS